MSKTVAEILDSMLGNIDTEIPKGPSEFAKKFYKNSKSSYMDSWPVLLYYYSIPTVMIQLTREERDYLVKLLNNELSFEENEAIRKWMLEDAPLEEQAISNEFFSFMQKIRKGASYFPQGFFLRLNSRSPKELLNREDYPNGIRSLKDAFTVFTGSIRIAEDIFRFHNLDVLPSLVFRPWMDIKMEEEFRCFIRDGKLIAITQYDYHKKPKFEYLQDSETREKIKNQVLELLEEVKDILPDDSIVMDIVWKGDKLIMLELNPYRGYLTDPCLFYGYDKIESIKNELVFAYVGDNEEVVYETYK